MNTVKLSTTHFGCSPSEVLQAATRTGGEWPDLGLIKPSYLVDVLLVDGDPLTDMRVLQDHGRFAFVMKD